MRPNKILPCRLHNVISDMPHSRHELTAMPFAGSVHILLGSVYSIMVLHFHTHMLCKPWGYTTIFNPSHSPPSLAERPHLPTGLKWAGRDNLCTFCFVVRWTFLFLLPPPKKNISLVISEIVFTICVQTSGLCVVNWTRNGRWAYWGGVPGYVT